MGAPSASRPTRCSICNRPACRGDCNKCYKKLIGDCKEFHLPVSHKEPIGTVYGWACLGCAKELQNVRD